MKIRTGFKISTIFAISSSLIIGFVLSLTTEKMNYSIERLTVDDEIVKGILELNIVTYDYLLHSGERARAQWQLKHASLGTILTGEAFKRPEERAILGKIRQNRARSESLFAQLVRSRENLKGGQGETAIFALLEKRLIGQLLVQSQDMVSRAFQLAERIRVEATAAQQRNAVLVMVLVGFIVTMVVATAFLINRRVVQPIARLHQGTEIIGAGNLDYKLGTAAQDEIGQLSRAFDQMTDQLHLITVSRDELAVEAAERQRAEEALSAAVSRNLVGQMLRDLQAIGAVSENVMHRAGQELAANMGAEALPPALETFSAMGLGSLALAETDEDLGRWTFMGHDLMEVNKDDDHPTCHYTRGFLHGAVQQITGGARVADTEAACQSMANATCRFVVQVISAQERADGARTTASGRVVRT